MVQRNKYMKVIYSLLLLITFSYADIWKKNPNEICVKHYPKHSIKISYQELCEFGKRGCEYTRKTAQVNVYCDEEKVSSCFSKKQWQTANEYVNISNKIFVKSTSKQMLLTKQKTIVKFCVITTKENQIMSNKKFKTYKQMTPQILGFMNKELSKDILCLEKEASVHNVKKCISKKDKSLEYMLFKIMPKKFSEICTTKKDTVLYFTWNQKNYQTVINELKKTVMKNKQNKDCLESSNTVDLYAKCLAKLQP